MQLMTDTFCDWYTATLTDDPENSMALICDTFGAQPCNKGFRGYKNLSLIHYKSVDGVQREWRLAYNDYGDRMNPSVDASSYAGADLRRFLIESEIPHEVTRFDVAVDFKADFDKVVGEVVAFGIARRLGLERVGDWVYGEGGRTQYVGSFKSSAYGRLYEKGKQLRQMGFHDADIDHLRMEVTIRPKAMKDGKRLSDIASRSEPYEILGMSRWASELFGKLFGMDIMRIRDEYLRSTDLDLALEHMLRQYGKLLNQKALELGSKDELGRWLVDNLWGQKER